MSRSIMSKGSKTIIHTPFPSPSETAREFGISKKRMLWLENIPEQLRIGLSSATKGIVIHFMQQLIHLSHPHRKSTSNQANHIRKCEVCSNKLRLVIKELRGFFADPKEN